MLDKIIIWPMMAEELETVEGTFNKLSQITGEDDFIIYPVAVDDWNSELSPWPYSDGKKIFTGGAKELFNTILEVRKNMAAEYPQAKFVLGGYSLAGLFSLWCGYETDAFDIIVSCSGSLWFPEFVDRYQKREIQAKAVYMSLGNKEKRCRDKIMAEIENRTMALYDSIDCVKKEYIVENGNHFTECRERMLRGFVWALTYDM